MCSKCDTSSWDFNVYQSNLNFVYKNTTKQFPVMTLTEYGQLSLGTENPEGSAIMQIDDTSRGLLIPRLTTSRKNTISSPANGLLVYDTDLQAFSFYDNGTWKEITVNSTLNDYLTVNDFNNSIAGNITQSDTANWNAACNFSQNFTETDPLFSAHLSSGITEQDTADWNTAFLWGNHADAGYITADSQDSLSNKTGNISMWNNDAGYITDASLNYLWQEDGNGNIYRENGNVGIGTKSPSKLLDIYASYDYAIGSYPEKSTIRLVNEIRYSKAIEPGPGPTPPGNKYYKWDIENDNKELSFKYIAYASDNIGKSTIPVTKFTFSGDGTLTAAKFVGDGSGLTNVSGLWQQNGNNIYYNTGNVGIGTDNPTADLQIEGRCLIRNLNGEDAFDVVNDAPANSLSSNTDLIWGRYKYRQDANPRILHFSTWDETKGRREIFTLRNNGNVQVGGTVICKKIIVKENPWADFVFNKTYIPIPLNELEAYIKQNKHLPNIPNEKQIKTKGLDLGEMQKLQMQKIEELTLYIIQLNKENERLKERILKLENK